MMEVYAGALAHCDYQMARILDTIEAQGELDNTLVIYIQGDNGASGEGGMQGLLNEMTMFNGIPEDMKEVVRRMNELGGPMTFNHYPVGWAHAMDTPFQWTKQIASHFGGTRNGLVISWPARIKDKGGLRTQFCSVIDIMPTLLEAAGVPAPTSINGVAQKPIEGTSLVYTFDDAKAPSKHTTQYFEMFANRGIYHDTSIVHGEGASRPGMPHAQILGRRLNRPVINLGFAGAGTMDIEVARLMAELDPCVYLVDCLPNMNAPLIAERVEPFVRTLRSARPETPIVLVEDRTGTNAWLAEGGREHHAARRKALREGFDRLQMSGVRGLHYVPGDNLLGDDDEATVDSSHPSDLGYMRYADALEPILRRLIAGEEPIVRSSQRT